MASVSLPVSLPNFFGGHIACFRSRSWPVRCASERQQLFSRIASVYDNLNDLLSLGQHRVWKRMAVSWSGAKLGDSVLDLCCVSGDLAFLLSEKVGPMARWVEADALNLPFPDCYVDAITMGYGLRNVIDRRKSMQEMLQVINQGSAVSIFDFNKSTQSTTASFQELVIDNIVVPVATVYGLQKQYEKRVGEASFRSRIF